MTVVTRFAPSPTGFLHIGSARTALFNWLYARHNEGKFLLRIEDTDQERSSQEAVDAILYGMEWLGLDHDGDVIYQSKGVDRHREVAEELVKQGKAYFCYCTKEELEAEREQAKKEKRPYKYNKKWRDKSPDDAPKGHKPVIRIKAPLTGETVIEDAVQGSVTTKNQEIDDFIILRSDKTPTYMLAVVVDDHDMGVTHIIRGDDHLTNTFKQKVIYEAMNWEVPHTSHIPLIHGPDGAKLSKRHGALGVDAYEEMGYLPDAMRNYLMRLGWSHGDDEIFSTEQAIKWFSLEHIGKSPSRFDFDKLANLNGHYIKERENKDLLQLVVPRVSGILKRTLEEEEIIRIEKGLESLKYRAKNIKELSENSLFYSINYNAELTEKAQAAIDESGSAVLPKAIELLDSLDKWNCENIEKVFQSLSEFLELKLGKVMAPIRAAITRSHMSPSMFEVIEILGKKETIARLSAFC